jgi:hypothetical protein
LSTGERQNLKSIRGIFKFHGQEVPGTMPDGIVFVFKRFFILWGTYALGLHRTIRAVRFCPDL